MKTAKCRSCGAPIIWALNDRTGNKAPIDAAPVDEGGNIIFVHERGHGGDPAYHVLDKKERELAANGLGLGVPKHTNHWQTCPTKEQHRKAGR